MTSRLRPTRRDSVSVFADVIPSIYYTASGSTLSPGQSSMQPPCGKSAPQSEIDLIERRAMWHPVLFLGCLSVLSQPQPSCCQWLMLMPSNDQGDNPS